MTANRQGPPIRDRINSKDCLFGLLQTSFSRLFAESSVSVGYDFIVIDAEHGTWRDGEVAETMKVLERSSVSAMVRLASQDREDAARYLALGADAIIVPHVDDAEQAELIAGAMEGFDQAAFIVLIESLAGVENSARIARLDRIDGVIVGPNDLSASLGVPAAFETPQYAAALREIERSAAGAGKAIGTVPHGPNTVEILRARGHCLFILSTDRRLIARGLGAELAGARDAIQLSAQP